MSPPRKKAKGDGAGKPDDTHSGVIRFEFDNDPSLSANQYGRFSSSVEVGGVPWEANVHVAGKEISANLYNMSADSMPWSMDVHAEFILINTDSDKNCSHTETETLRNHNCIVSSRYCMMDLSELNSEEKGFLKDNKLTIDIHFTISNMKGIRNSPSIDFTTPNEPCHDLALNLNGGKLFVSKQILAVNSPVFKAMFYGDFDEKGKKEIELKDIYREEFLEMLRLIYYPFYKKITADKVEFLLKLADQYEITCVINRVEAFLIDTNKVARMKKLRIADAYRLEALLDHCLGALKSTQDFKNVKESPMYGDLSAETMRALFDRSIATRK